MTKPVPAGRPQKGPPELIDTGSRLFDEDPIGPEELASLEREALQDVARVMFAWAARLPDESDVARRFGRTAERLTC